jgi:hypothetical protein
MHMRDEIEKQPPQNLDGFEDWAGDEQERRDQVTRLVFTNDFTWEADGVEYSRSACTGGQAGGL